MESILAVLVLYNSKLEESVAFVSLTESLNQLGSSMDILVYDNSPAPMYSTDKKHPEWNVYYVHDPDNSGISKAYNHGLSIAKENNKKWLLLLDQDTSFPLNALSIYSEAIKLTRNATLFAPKLISRGRIISPFKTGLGKGKILESVAVGEQSFDDIMPINSGILISKDLMIDSGGYNEDFPLDFSDFAFIHRLKKILPKFQIIDLECNHQFSGFDMSDKKTSLARFKNFCNAVMLYKSSIEPDMNAFIILFTRTLKLTLAFKTLSFLKVSFSYYLKRQ